MGYDFKFSTLQVTADRNYSPGDEVFIKYGEFSNATLMLDFGFTLPYKFMTRHHTRLSKISISFTRLVILSQSSREVKSAIGKGKGIPQSLRAFARVLCCTIPQELNDLSKEAAQNDGRLARLPFENRSRELEAHKILLSHINRLIADHSACIKEMEESKAILYHKDLLLEGRWQKISYTVSFVF
ncbi:Rubisco LSMT substrate-binding domain [Arabidopsis thaliana x Arabidopsis arenosa]|uniref:Rubisco LSMT substrate-binding domain n=1 Tax=Arabidopsis thaliana x Arabidopsis arenosa TaxID=1240361 RepID=A0A8T2EZ88_9BRAS|nr:Rubisco LSMT substrate-binding domain [Arabidopsis thaliana x Arabidopsis arenosa]